MLTVKTKIKQSPIHGIGLFADEFIPKGTIIWKLQNGFDIMLTEEEYNSFPKITQDFITHFEYFDKELDRHILCADNARFFNRSEIPNCIGKDGDTIAAKDIEIGDELTEIYYNLTELG